jgi:hypothetical protein
MYLTITHAAELSADQIDSHIYPGDSDGMYIELGTRYKPNQSVMLWAGRAGADWPAEAAALRKLAAEAVRLAAVLDERAGAAQASQAVTS